MIAGNGLATALLGACCASMLALASFRYSNSLSLAHAGVPCGVALPTHGDASHHRDPYQSAVLFLGMHPATQSHATAGWEGCSAASGDMVAPSHHRHHVIDEHQISPARCIAAGLSSRVLSAFAPTGHTTRCRARLSGLQDAECDRRSAHVTKASRHRRHVLAHAGSDAQEISEFVVPPAIAPC